MEQLGRDIHLQPDAHRIAEHRGGDRRARPCRSRARRASQGHRQRPLLHRHRMHRRLPHQTRQLQESPGGRPGCGHDHGPGRHHHPAAQRRARAFRPGDGKHGRRRLPDDLRRHLHRDARDRRALPEHLEPDRSAIADHRQRRGPSLLTRPRARGVQGRASRPGRPRGDLDRDAALRARLQHPLGAGTAPHRPAPR